LLGSSAAFHCPDVSTGLCNDRMSVRCLSVWLSVPLIDSSSNNASDIMDSTRLDDVTLRTAIEQCTRSLGLGYKLRSNTSCRSPAAGDYFSGAYKVIATGAESAVYDCVVL